ncbi:dehydratase [Pikeienuella piscinae]|uniref:Dehydratase n=1 Tax=Pikeienuella piscinae TaxID=2748098 RepID=A0A7L5C329_9RHOB|nr:MaoC/PaaZ C-terminal domain-containing protein [Pikeienuella piscinae]QIE56674.1 dehydratase [Pikeienuella piscinae]
MKSMYYEDFEPGQVFESSGRTITESDLTFFSMVSGDWNKIHNDAAYAAGTPFGERIVHGPLGIAICFGFIHAMGIFDDSVVAMTGIEDWKFEKPILVNTTLHLRLTITGKSMGRSGRTGKLGRKFELLDQEGNRFQSGSSDVLIQTRAGIAL